MATNSEFERAEHTDNFVLERCLAVLHTAKDDNEQFAALLLVTKAVRAGEVDSKTRRRIFEAVGFTFPNRLLASKQPPDGSPDHIFRALGIALLSSYCTDPELAAQPQVLNKISIFNEILVTRYDTDDLSFRCMIDDTYQCLVGISAVPGGSGKLVSHGCVSALCQAYLQHTYGRDQAVQLLTGLLVSMGEKCWNKSNCDLMELLNCLCKDFKKSKDMSKFKLCEILHHFLPPSPLLMESSQGVQCLKNICSGLQSILQSKLSACQRDPAFTLAASLTSSYGIGWLSACSSTKGSTFLPLLVNLACVEVRMWLEDAEPSVVDTRQELVTACYSIMELGIQECIKEDSSLLSEDQKLQLVLVMEEACAAVIHYLAQVGHEKLEDPFVFASVRILSAWLAEETSSLKQEICNLLPFLVHYAKTLFQRQQACKDLPKQVAELALCSSSWGSLWPGDALRFLLPALYHLTAEDGPCHILISQGAPSLLCEYFLLQWQVYSSENTHLVDAKCAVTSLQTACGIFLNFAITTPELIRQEVCFSSLMNTLVKALPTLLSQREHLTLAATMATLGLMITRSIADSSAMQKTDAKDFIKAAVLFFSQAHTSGLNPDNGLLTIRLSEGYEEAWPDVSELWFLGMQAFGSCLSLLPWLLADVIEIGWPEEIVELLSRVAPASVDLELIIIYEAILVEIVKISPSFKQLLLSSDWVEQAYLYGMAELEQHLREVVTGKPVD